MTVKLIEMAKEQKAPCLEDAIILAAEAHRGQMDKGGKPYILHVLRVLLRQRDENAQIVAALHDVIEDTHLTQADLRRAGYKGEICAAVDCLTRLEGEPYEDMIDRVAANPIAREVKLADLEDNMNLQRLGNPDETALVRMAKYKSAWSKLNTDQDAEVQASAFDINHLR
jgi:(p)ppGpp synthase/HD superfamily hydrolase